MSSNSSQSAQYVHQKRWGGVSSSYTLFLRSLRHTCHKTKSKIHILYTEGPGILFWGNNSIFHPRRSLSCHLERCLIRMGTKRIMIPFGHGPLSELISLINDQTDDNPIFWKCVIASSPHWVNEGRERGSDQP